MADDLGATLSKAYVQDKGERKGRIYRIKRGVKSGGAVRVYTPSNGKGTETALVKSSLPKTLQKKPNLAYAGPLVQKHSAKHGGDMWSYRRGAGGKLIPVKKS